MIKGSNIDLQQFIDNHSSFENCNDRRPPKVYEDQNKEESQICSLSKPDDKAQKGKSEFKLLAGLNMMPKKLVDWNKDEIIYFKEEAIYLKKDITDLHTIERWRKDGRQVVENSVPVRRVKGLYK